MMVETFAKPKYKSKNRKTVHDFSQAVKRTEYEDAKGICRICQCKPITQYHHANEKGMGGGRGLGIQINCLGVDDICHNHDNTEFLRKSNEILKGRAAKLFYSSPVWPVVIISEKSGMRIDSMTHQIAKGFLKTRCTKNGTIYANTKDIYRWLGLEVA